MHDILPGTTTPDVDVYSRIDYERIFELGQAALSGALDAIASNVGSGAPGFVLFNPLSWERDDVARVRLNGAPPEFHASPTAPGRWSRTRCCVGTRTESTCCCAVRGVPSCGYAGVCAAKWAGPGARSLHVGERGGAGEPVLPRRARRAGRNRVAVRQARGPRGAARGFEGEPAADVRGQAARLRRLGDRNLLPGPHVGDRRP